MKYYLLLFLSIPVFYKSVCAQQNNLAGTLTGYVQTIKLSSKTKPEDVYTLAQNWINNNPALFSTKNAEAPSEAKPKNKQAVEEAYGNSRPLQTLDPSANRIVGLGLIKYFGGTRTSIRLMYVKYDINITAKAGQVVFKVGNVRYYHFDPKNYNEAGIFSFSVGKPCDNTGTMDYLVACQSSPEEFKTLAAFFHQTVTGLSSAFTKELKAKKMLPEANAKQVAAKPNGNKPAALQAGAKH